MFEGDMSDEWKSNSLEWADFDERFEICEEHLDYVDAPLQGFVRSRASGERYAFRRTMIIAHHLWHWVLLGSLQDGVSPEVAFDAALAAPPQYWISVIEDRRTSPQSRYTAAMMTGVPLPWPPKRGDLDRGAEVGGPAGPVTLGHPGCSPLFQTRRDGTRTLHHRSQRAITS
jgi:hypothetical protein